MADGYKGVKHKQCVWRPPILASSMIAAEASGRNEVIQLVGKEEGREES